MVEVVCFGCGMSVGVEGLMGWEEFEGVEGSGVGVFMGWGVVVGVGMGREGGSTSVGVWQPGRLWAARGWRRL